MTPALSIHLDAVRFLAALTVFWAHVSGQRLTGGLVWQLGPYADPAVVVFFVLSGFVVAYASDRRGMSGRSFFVARAARVLSVAIPALVLTFGLDLIGSTVNPGYYAPWWGYREDGQLWQYLTAFTFTGQFWWTFLPVGSNLPYWSLQYEVWYYVIFGIVTFMTGHVRWVLFGVIAAVGGPAILVLLPIWLMGVAAYHICRTHHVPQRHGAALAIGAVLAWVAYEVADRLLGNQGMWTVLRRSDLLRDYVTGLLFALHVLGVHALTRDWPAPKGRIIDVIRWLAGATFTLYLLHLPVAQFLAAVAPGASASWGKRAVVVLGTLAVIFAVAQVTERRKEDWRRGIERLTRRIERAPPHRA